jgi:hypothetical protein
MSGTADNAAELSAFLTDRTEALLRVRGEYDSLVGGKQPAL